MLPTRHSYVAYGNVHNWEGAKYREKGIHPRVYGFNQGPGTPDAMSEWLTTLTHKIREVDVPRLCLERFNSLTDTEVKALTEDDVSVIKKDLFYAIENLFLSTIENATKEDPVAKDWLDRQEIKDLKIWAQEAQANKRGTFITQSLDLEVKKAKSARSKACSSKSPQPGVIKKIFSLLAGQNWYKLKSR